MKKIATPKLLMVIATLGMASVAFAQQPKIFGKTIPAEGLTPNGKVRCATTQYEENLQEKYPARPTRAEFQQWLAPKIEQRRQNPVAFSTNAVVTIPVVVHVIHNGDAYGSNENITDEQVLSQIEVLNQDYRRMEGTQGFNDHPDGADIEIEFCLAQVDPDGNSTNGIDRQQVIYASLDEDEVTSVQLQTQWDPNDYMNIWVYNFDPAMGLLGFAQFPNNTELPGAPEWNGPADTDGIVIGYQYFGSEEIYPDGNYEWPYNEGRTTTHEVGHFFGLEHIWGQGFSNPNCNDSDFCDDTPESEGPNGFCEAHFSCDSWDMIENYMDYTNDDCMNIFTQDQKERILTVLENSPRRASLLNSDVCTATAGQDDFKLLNGINVYPNPARDILNIEAADNELPDGYVIYNSLGQVMANVKVTGNSNLTVNISGYSNGMYFIKIDKGTQSKTIKFIKD